MTKPKLLISTDSFLPRIDGVTRFLMEIIPPLRERFDITVVAPTFPGKQIRLEKVNIVYIPLSSWRAGDYQFAKYRPRILRQLVKKNDVVFNQSLGTIGINAIRMAKKEKKPVVSFIHSIDWELAAQSIGTAKKLVALVVKWVAKRTYKKCTKLIFPSQQAALKYEEQGIVRPSRIVSLGVDIHRFKPSHSKAMAKRNIGIDANKLVIGFCGRIGREKDLGTLKNAFDKIKENYPVVLLIVGEGVDESLQGDGVILAGRQNDVVPYLQAMDIYVLPSLTETTSLSTLEAMACGLPVICTPVGSLKEYIKHRQNGYLFPRGNVERLSQYLQILLRNPQKRQQLGMAARKTVGEKFHWEDTVKGIIKVLEKFTKL